MGDITDIPPPSNPFALQIARRQYEEARRQLALLPRFSRGQPSSLLAGVQKPVPSSGVALVQGHHPYPDQPGLLGSSLLQPVDDATPLQLSRQAPGPANEPGAARPSIAGDGLLNTLGGAGIAAPLLIGAAGVAAFPEDIPLILLALGLMGTMRSSNPAGLPPLEGSTRPPLGVLPGLPLPKPAPPPTTPPIVGKPASGGTAGGADVGKSIDGPAPTAVPPTILTGPDLVGKTLADMILQSNPDGSRGKPLTRLSNNIVIQECMKAATDRLPELAHIGGGSRDGDVSEGAKTVPETYIPGPKGRRLGSSRSDVSFDLATNKLVSTHINTTSMKKNGEEMTSREQDADERLARNLKRFRDKGVRKYTIRKLTPGDDVDTFRAEARALCQKMIDDLKKELANAPQGEPTMQDPAPE